MRSAIIHYWLLNRRGGEKVLDSLCRLLPEADIYTLFCNPRTLSEEVRRHKIVVSSLDPFRRWHRNLLPLMPMALEAFDLRGYDLIVSSESGPAKGVLAPSTARHVCYCHTPMRYLWDLYPAYLNDWTRSRIKRALIAPFAHYMRLWDYASASRVDRFIANSRNVRTRIWKTYRRESEVIYPPVDVETFRHERAEDYFLAVSELVPYKRIDLLVKHFTRTGQPLRIAGDGPDSQVLRAAAGRNIQFLGRVSDADLRDLYARCRAFLMPGEEDFGITPVEALASGKPVIAFGRGGALETVPPFGGILFDRQDEESLAAAMSRFEQLEPEIQHDRLQQWTRQFSTAEFELRMAAELGPAAEAEQRCSS
jgi:glycosyltransferase involved in cell wall biosynthesis